MTGHKLDNKEALKFIFAGKSLVTFVNTNTGNRFTFKVKQAKNSNLFFVSVLTSPEVYTYIGTATDKINSKNLSLLSAFDRDFIHSGPIPVAILDGTVSVLPHLPHLPSCQTSINSGRVWDFNLLIT